MAKQSREKIIAELDARKLGYDEKMTDEQLGELLEKEKQAEKDAEKASAVKGKKKNEPLNIEYTGVRCGLSTIHDLHKRLFIVEKKLKLR